MKMGKKLIRKYKKSKRSRKKLEIKTQRKQNYGGKNRQGRKN